MAAADVVEADVEVWIEFLEELTPQNTAIRDLALASNCDSISITAAVHPLVTEVIETRHARGMAVFAVITQLSAAGQLHYGGLDNWKVGRTAAGAMHHICHS